MGKVKSEKNTTVIIQLDRPRVVKYGHKALKMISSLTNKKLNELSTGEFSLEDLEIILYCGILNDAIENGESLKLEDMEDLLDKAENFNVIINAMNDALNNAFQETETQKN